MGERIIFSAKELPASDLERYTDLARALMILKLINATKRSTML